MNRRTISIQENEERLSRGQSRDMYRMKTSGKALALALAAALAAGALWAGPVKAAAAAAETETDAWTDYTEVIAEEVLQAAKYCPYLEIMFGPGYEVIPVLILTTALERFEFVPIGKTDAVIPICSGDMLFNVFDEYLGFLR